MQFPDMLVPLTPASVSNGAFSIRIKLLPVVQEIRIQIPVHKCESKLLQNHDKSPEISCNTEILREQSRRQPIAWLIDAEGHHPLLQSLLLASSRLSLFSSCLAAPLGSAQTGVPGELQISFKDHKLLRKEFWVKDPKVLQKEQTQIGTGNAFLWLTDKGYHDLVPPPLSH